MYAEHLVEAATSSHTRKFSCGTSQTSALWPIHLVVTVPVLHTVTVTYSQKTHIVTEDRRCDSDIQSQKTEGVTGS